jgi:predicted membrane-bound spermidine synthase
MKLTIYLIFIASGASALIFEALWFRQAGLAFGNSIWASSLVLSGFMGGLALGNALAAIHGDRLKNPIRVYAIVEVAIGLTGIGLVYLLPILGAVLAPWLRPLLEHPWILNPIRLMIAFLLLLIPSTAMGVTLPLLTKALMAHNTHFGSVLGKLYGWNTLGAVSGVAIGESYLIGALGVRGTALAAGGLNLTAAIVAGWLSMQSPLQDRSPLSSGRQALGWTSGRRFLAAAFISGFCLLALEVVWFRFLLLFVMGHSVAFALMLAIVLAGIALGGLAASLWLRLFTHADRIVSPIAFLTGLACVVSYATFALVIQPFADPPHSIVKAVDVLRVGLPLMFPVSFLSGAFFTLVGSALRNHLATEITTTGVLTLANTVGAALGSLVGGFMLLPLLGMEKSFFLIALLYGVIGALLMVWSPVPRARTYASAALFLLSTALFPFGSMEKNFLVFPAKPFLRVEPNTRIAEIREGLTETVIYLDVPLAGKSLNYRMLTNSFSMSSTKPDARRYMKLYVYWPMAVHPNIKRALLICYGVGNTAKALTDSKSIETIDVVDISRDVLEANHIVYPNQADQPLRDPRVRVHIEDGRYFLQTTDQRFDLITAEPPPPQLAGVVNLYTREYFQLLDDRLADGGIVAYWLPLHNLNDVSAKAILRSFCDVFEDCSLWNGTGRSLMMIGTRDARGPVSETQFVRQWNDPLVAGEMKRLALERPEQLGALFIGDAEYLKGIVADSPPLVDNDPKVIEAPLGSKEEVDRIFRSITDESSAKERFVNSSLIRRLWPERLLQDSIPYFDYQAIINTLFYGTPTKENAAMEDAHILLTRSPLSTPVLLLLGSTPDIQRIIAQADPAELQDPSAQFHLGIRLISERNYAAAAESLKRGEQLPQLRDKAFRLRIYALCMSGRIEQARQLARERLVQLVSEKGAAAEFVNGSDLSPYWSWMKKTFGIDPLADVRVPPVRH